MGQLEPRRRAAGLAAMGILVSAAACGQLLGLDDPREVDGGADAARTNDAPSDEVAPGADAAGDDADVTTGSDTRAPSDGSNVDVADAPDQGSTTDAGCASNAQCTGTLPVCDPSSHACRACATDNDCAPFTGSTTCDKSTGRCVACTTTNRTACGADQECVANACQTCATTAAALANWTKPVVSGPTGSEGSAMTYDRNHGVALLVQKAAGETWSWNGSNWSALCGAGGKPSCGFTGRNYHALTFDTKRARAVLYGGDDANELADMWLWNGDTASWTQACSSCAPGSRSMAAMAYDESRDVVVLFGGTNGASYPNAGWALDDTWEWTPSTNMWKLVCGPTTTPSCPVPARNAAKMVYDPVLAKIVLFGGNTIGATTSVAIDDTWTYGASGWTKVITSQSPPGRKHHAMAFDRRSNTVVVEGGRDTSDTSLFDTWSFNGTCWKDATSAPGPGVWKAGSTFDEKNDHMVIFAGQSATGSSSDTNVW